MQLIMNSGVRALSTISSEPLSWASSDEAVALQMSAGGPGRFIIEGSVDQGSNWMPLGTPGEFTFQVTGGADPVGVLVPRSERGFTHLRVLFEATHAANKVQVFAANEALKEGGAGG